MLLRLDRRRPHCNGHNNAHDELQASMQKVGISTKDVNEKEGKTEKGEEVSMEVGKENTLGHVGKRCYEHLARKCRRQELDGYFEGGDLGKAEKGRARRPGSRREGRAEGPAEPDVTFSDLHMITKRVLSPFRQPLSSFWERQNDPPNTPQHSSTTYASPYGDSSGISLEQSMRLQLLTTCLPASSNPLEPGMARHGWLQHSLRESDRNLTCWSVTSSNEAIHQVHSRRGRRL
ncbi:hypothetical protein FA13DRAFT_1863681 [Coprinellus micaceus]|uniref:Uncharacterized protein n=1 Tax=Coprinellus micaceus TaxID=71717 RepID=A0A4Y7T7D9_COPMI|nr:hypothetical protein FA13DRAFT_1863681 [Coprinellus micaceus]